MLSALNQLKRKLRIATTYRRAVKGYLPAQYEIGTLYHELGGECLAQSFAWLTIASNHGHSKALSELATLEAKLSPPQLNEGRKLAGEYKRNFDTLPRCRKKRSRHRIKIKAWFRE